MTGNMTLRITFNRQLGNKLKIYSLISLQVKNIKMFYLYYLCFVMQKSTGLFEFVFIIINCAPCSFNYSRRYLTDGFEYLV